MTEKSKINFSEIEIGDLAPEMRHELNRTDLVRYAGVSGDYNPMHHDEIMANKAGLPSVFGHGMFSAGFLATAITSWVGVGNLKSYRIRFVKQTWPGETFVTKIVVTGKRTEGGDNLVDLDCEMLNDVGEVKVSGQATAQIYN